MFIICMHAHAHTCITHLCMFVYAYYSSIHPRVFVWEEREGKDVCVQFVKRRINISSRVTYSCLSADPFYSFPGLSVFFFCSLPTECVPLLASLLSKSIAPVSMPSTSKKSESAIPTDYTPSFVGDLPHHRIQ